jgi:hypothetical protein
VHEALRISTASRRQKWERRTKQANQNEDEDTEFHCATPAISPDPSKFEGRATRISPNSSGATISRRRGISCRAELGSRGGSALAGDQLSRGTILRFTAFTTASSGNAWAVRPPSPVTVSAIDNALRMASSVASAAA